MTRNWTEGTTERADPVEAMPVEDPPLKNILIPTDGSDVVDKGLRMIAPIASCCQATIHALYVYPEGSHTRDRIRSDPITTGEQTVEEFAQRLRRKGLETETAVRTGVPDEEIRTYADEADIDLVVMVTHSHSPLNILRGSVTEDVIRKSDTPVMALSS